MSINNLPQITTTDNVLRLAGAFQVWGTIESLRALITLKPLIDNTWPTHQPGSLGEFTD